VCQHNRNLDTAIGILSDAVAIESEVVVGFWPRPVGGQAGQDFAGSAIVDRSLRGQEQLEIYEVYR
jgi:hypothetical protein